MKPWLLPVTDGTTADFWFNWASSALISLLLTCTVKSCLLPDDAAEVTVCLSFSPFLTGSTVKSFSACSSDNDEGVDVFTTGIELNIGEVTERELRCDTAAVFLALCFELPVEELLLLHLVSFSTCSSCCTMYLTIELEVAWVWDSFSFWSVFRFDIAFMDNVFLVFLVALGVMELSVQTFQGLFWWISFFKCLSACMLNR